MATREIKTPSIILTRLRLLLGRIDVPLPLNDSSAIYASRLFQARKIEKYANFLTEFYSEKYREALEKEGRTLGGKP